jgi:hypothetical protein
VSSKLDCSFVFDVLIVFGTSLNAVSYCGNDVAASTTSVGNGS